jgi:hypothetical protein
MSVSWQVMLSAGDYRTQAEEFTEAISREHYLHLAGHKPTLELDSIYARHADLFTREAVEGLRLEPNDRHLLMFALDGLLGNETSRLEEQLAGLEASLEVETRGEKIGFRQVAVAMANEADGERRAALEAARDAVATEKLDPLHREMLERAHELCRELGWEGYAAAYADLRGLDFGALAKRTREFLAETDAGYARVLDPELDRVGVPPLGKMRRSDLPRLFRAEHLDRPFSAERMVPALRRTLAGMGIDLDGQANVTLDADPRPTKSPRAFCSTPRVPDEVYLVVAPVGGRSDYDALFHEAGHTEHYAHVERTLAFEHRHLGDNAVTESFAFLVEQLVSEPAWLEDMLGVDDAAESVSHARAAKLVMLRRYAAKLDYELELNSPAPDLGAMPARYAELLGGATRINWPVSSWLSDVDGGFYVACYLRAWALETHWRAALRERFGERWYANREAGDWLRGLWREGQRLDAEELLQETLGEELSFARLAAELTETT